MKNHFFKTDSRRSQSGVAAVEMALVLIILLPIMAGIVEFGRTFWYYNALAKATRGAARVVSIDKTAVALAKTVAVDIANSARISPSIDTSNVQITLTSDTVTASINGFAVTLGDWIPFFSSSDGVLSTADMLTLNLAPSTTMRYMK